MSIHTNIHGRKPGRGIRPWLLIPKVLAVAGFFGGSLAAMALTWHYLSLMIDQYDEPARIQLQHAPHLLRIIFLAVIVPSTCVALVTGIGLLITNSPRIMLRQRWLVVKLALVALGVPVMHFLMVIQMHRVEDVLEQGLRDPGPLQGFFNGTIVLILGCVLLIFLGRHKPRL
ncbi:MAG: hypothetical protein MI741_24185, partial [Rhodospirillales bacterium]|nr:hypothetical protein [Rhodospirillales bacterium]